MNTKMLYALAVITIWAVIVIPHTNAEVDCNEHPPKFVHPKECCPVPDLISEELMETCREQVGMAPPPPEEDLPENDEAGRHHHHRGPHGHHGHHHHHHCFASCILNATNILVDGQLDENALDIYLNEVVSETPDIIPVLKESYQMCYEKAEEIMTRMREHFEKDGNGPPHKGRGPPQGRCSPQGGIIFHCAMMNTLKQCPDTIWTGTEECNAMREFFTECVKRPEDNE